MTAPTPPQLAVAIVAVVPVLALFVLIVGRLASGWSAVVARYPMQELPPPEAHRVVGQRLHLGQRIHLPGFVTVAVGPTDLWIGFTGPAAWVFAPVCVPLADVTLQTAENWMAAGTRVLLSGVPKERILLFGDGAQIVIARLG